MFPLVWTVLYLLIGTAAWLVWLEPGHRRPLRAWGWQLAANSLWSPAFFGLHSTWAGLAAIIVLLFAIGRTILSFRSFSSMAAALMVPYAAWTCYAAYLNAGFVWLNALR